MSTTTETSAADLVIVSRDTFKLFFEQARRVSPIIRKSTSSMDGEPYLTHSTYRVARDGRSGYVVRPDGELVFVFSLERGRGRSIVELAKLDGAVYLDCFDGYLPTLYGRHDFVEVKRVANWTPGEPDVVFMSLPGFEHRHGVTRQEQECERHGGPWGLDSTCVACTDPSGDPRPVTA